MAMKSNRCKRHQNAPLLKGFQNLFLTIFAKNHQTRQPGGFLYVLVVYWGFVLLSGENGNLHRVVYG